MSGKGDKKLRRVVNKKVARDNQEIFQAFMLEISAQPFWQRFMFCLRMAFKFHPLQRSMKDQIRARKRLLKAHKIATTPDRNILAHIVSGFLVGMTAIAIIWMIFEENITRLILKVGG